MEKAHLAKGYLSTMGDIKFFDLKNPQSYLPLPVLYDYLGRLTKELGVTSLAARFLKQFDFEDLGDYGVLLTQCPDLLSVIVNGIKYDKYFQTNSRMFLEIHGTTAKFYHYYTDAPSEGHFICQDMGLAMAICAFKMVLGDDWRPYAIGLTPHTSKTMLQLLPEPTKMPLQFNSNYQSFTFDTKCLVKPNLKNTDLNSAFNGDLTTFSERIEALITSIKPGYMPNLKEISKFINISERTINRGLESEDTSFSKLVQQHLFRKSIGLMHQSTMTINEIADYMGYANGANFVRAFKTWTRVTPNTYRQQIV